MLKIVEASFKFFIQGCGDEIQQLFADYDVIFEFFATVKLWT